MQQQWRSLHPFLGDVTCFEGKGYTGVLETRRFHTGVTICMMCGVSARGRERRRAHSVITTSFTRPGSVLAGSLLLRI